jgi:hypothetical protein
MKTPDAKTRYERNSLLEDWSGWFLLAGLLLEIVILFLFSKGKSQLAIILEALAYVMVFGGVFGEIHFASKAKSADAELKRESDKQVAESNRLATEANLKAETERVERLKLELELLEARRIDAIATQSILVTTERLAAAQGLRAREEMTDAARSLEIIPKIKTFAGTQFDAIATSRDIGISTLLLVLKQGLKAAGWIEVDRSNIGPIQREQASVSDAPFVKIHLDAVRDSKLLEPAFSLASALNEEGIEAVIMETEIGIASENTIHILIGSKPKPGR